VVEAVQIRKCEEDLEMLKGATGLAKGDFTSVLQVLVTLRCLINHPALLLGHEHSERVRDLLKGPELELKRYQNSGKYLALKQILNDLGFKDVSASRADVDFLQNSNKLLIFSRFKANLELIADSLLSVEFPELKYLVLTGVVEPQKR